MHFSTKLNLYKNDTSPHSYICQFNHFRHFHCKIFIKPSITRSGHKFGRYFRTTQIFSWHTHKYHTCICSIQSKVRRPTTKLREALYSWHTGSAQSDRWEIPQVRVLLMLLSNFSSRGLMIRHLMVKLINSRVPCDIADTCKGLSSLQQIVSTCIVLCTESIFWGSTLPCPISVFVKICWNEFGDLLR